MVKIINGVKYYNVWRNKKREDKLIHLWYASSNLAFIVSLVGSRGNVSIRISTPKGNIEYALPFTDSYSFKYPKDEFGTRRDFRMKVEGMIKRDFGYNVLLRE